MRKIEREMNRAIAQKRNWISGNTEVLCHEYGETDVYLHGNLIAVIVDGDVQVNVRTLSRWPTRTTMSRLNALGASVYQRKHVVYLDGEAVA